MPSGLTTRTNSTGQYSTWLSTGTYTIKFAKAGYATATIRKTVTSAMTLNAALTPMKPAGATALQPVDLLTLWSARGARQ